MFRNPEYQKPDGTPRDEAPDGYADATASDELTPLEQVLIDVLKDEYLKIKARRLPQARIWARTIVGLLPPSQTFERPALLAAFLMTQYKARAARMGEQPHWGELLLLPELAEEIFADEAENGRSLAAPRAKRSLRLA